MAEKTEGSDHAHEGREWLKAADREACDNANVNARPIDLAVVFASVAQANATLAVAEQLERLNDKLAAPSGDFSQFLDLLREDIGNIVWHNTGGGR